MIFHGTTRGLGGIRKPFSEKNLPSQRYKNPQNLIQPTKEETEEQKLQRHKEFFKGLSSLAPKSK
jgi:hypothetical protein